jgi:hypothetical protein
MTFDDLPDHWSDLPLDTAGLAADVADLFVSVADRESGCVALLLTDAERRLAQPLVIHDVAPDADPQPLAGFLTQLSATLRAARGAVVLVRGRPGGVLLTEADRRWHDLVLSTCRREQVPVLGAFLATPAVVRAFPGAVTEDDLAS